MTDHTAPRTPTPKSRWFSAGIGGVGLASLFSDSSHEMVTSLLPSFLTSTLHASAGALGLIEGFSDALTGVMKLVGGPLANDPNRRGKLAGGGYVGTALATAAIGLTTMVWQAGVLRAFAWISRGLRSPSRDAMLASLAPREHYGKAFGVERAGDNLGAVVGPLLAAALVGAVGIRTTMLISFIPGVLAAVAITVAARQAARLAAPIGQRVRFDFGALRRAGLLVQLLPVVCFELGNMATTILILRATQLLTYGGRAPAAAAVLAIVIYAAHNAFGALVAFLGGRWIDNAGPRVVFGAGVVLYIAAYLAFAESFHSPLWLLLAFVCAGSAIGFAETAESTLVARVVPDALHGSGFGFLGGVQAFGDFTSTAVVGLLYAAVSPAVGFLYATAWMAIALVVLMATSRRPRRTVVLRSQRIP